MLLATASQAALERSSSGRMRTWLRTPTRPLSRRQPRKLKLLRDLARLPFAFVAIAVSLSPPLGLEVVHVHVLADSGIGNHAADVLAVLDDGVALFEALQRHLVADGNGGFRLELQRLIGFCDDTQHVGAAGEPFDDDDAHIILGAVNQKLW